MNKYYILKPAVGTKETGMAYPAVESYDDYDFDGPRSMHKLKFREFPDFEPDIRFKLAKGAKLCDMMGQATISGHGFLISEKLKTILEETNTVPCRFYCATIEHKGEIHQYYWVHFVWKEANEYIDFPKSTFYIRKFSSKLGEIKLNNYHEYLLERDKIGNLKIIDFNKLIIKPVPFDLFLISFRGEIFIKKSLVEVLFNSNLIGLSFKESAKLVES